MKSILLLFVILNFFCLCKTSSNKDESISKRNFQWKKTYLDSLKNSYYDILFEDSNKLISNKYINGELESYLIFDHLDKTNFRGSNYVKEINSHTFFLPDHQYDPDSILIRVIFGLEQGNSSYGELFKENLLIKKNNFSENPCWSIKIPFKDGTEILDSLRTGYYINYKLSSKGKLYERRCEIILYDWWLPKGWRH